MKNKPKFSFGERVEIALKTQNPRINAYIGQELEVVNQQLNGSYRIRTVDGSCQYFVLNEAFLKKLVDNTTKIK